MGRAAGCPARPGRVGKVRTAVEAAPAADGCAAGDEERAMGEAVGPDATRTGSGGRIPPGNGCRGPERICPGLGAAEMDLGTGGAGRPGAAGMAEAAAGVCARGAPGVAGDDDASGGRSRCGCGARRAGNLSSTEASRAGSASRAISGTCVCGFSSCAGAALGSSSTTAVAAPFELACSARSAAPALPPKTRRSLSATSSSIELEWVFFSVTPSSGSLSSSS
jgi:hypothetical protein